MERRFYNIKEVACYLGFTVSAIRKWIRTGQIPFHHINGAIRFDIKEIDRWAVKDKMKTVVSPSASETGNFFQGVTNG